METKKGKNTPPKVKQGFGGASSRVLFLKRLKALIIDLFMIYTPILYVMTYFILGGKEVFQESQLAIFVCVFLYGVIDSLFCWIASQTPGMRAQGLIIRDSKGNPPFFFLGLFRFFVWLVSLGFLFGFVFPFFRKDRKTFHDFVCRTSIELSVFSR